MNNITDINLLGPDEQRRRLDAISFDGPILIADTANIYWLTGRIFVGWLYVDADRRVSYFVRRPSTLTGADIVYVRKPEEILAHLPAAPSALGLELASLSYADAERLRAAMGTPAIANASPALMEARAVKTPAEIAKLRADGLRQAEVYSHIPALFREGMTDVELQTEIEYLSRRRGCLGIFRVSGPSMEIYMGSVLTGQNADTPSAYDFAMGGAGLDPSLPVGACGEVIAPGAPVMVDMNGNFNGYMTDMTRTFTNGTPRDPRVETANRLSADICRALAAMGRPGVAAKELYLKAEAMAAEAGMKDLFMGHRHHAPFVGHGVGIQVNELPVLAPKSKSILAEGNVIAIEPKFVIPGVGAVGIENTYVCTSAGLECLTPAPEALISLI